MKAVKSYNCVGWWWVVVLSVMVSSIFAETESGESIDGLTRKLPDRTIGFMACSGTEAIEPAFKKSSMGQLWYDPGVQSFCQQVWEAFKFMIMKEMNEKEKGQFHKAMRLTRIGLSNPFVIGFASLETPTDDVPGYGYLIIDAGANKAEVAGVVAELEVMALEGDIVETQIGAYAMHKPVDDKGVPVYWGWVGKHFVLAINDAEGRSVKNVAAERQGKVASYVFEKVHRFGGVDDLFALHVDLEEASNIFKAMLIMKGDQNDLKTFDVMVGKLGLSSVKTFVNLTGFSGKNLVNDIMIEGLGQPARGLPAQFESVDRAMLDYADARAMTVGLVNIEVAGLYDVVMDAIEGVVEEDEYAGVVQRIARVEKQLGFRIREGLLDSLAGPMMGYALPGGAAMEAPMGGFVFIVELDDPTPFEQCMVSLSRFASQMSEGMVIAGEQQQEQQTIHTLTIAPLAMMQIMPSWTILDKKMILASNMPLCQNVINNMTGKNEAYKSIKSDPTFREATANMPDGIISLMYMNSQQTYRHGLLQAQQFWPLMSMGLAQEGIMLPAVLPNPSEVINQMEPLVEYTWFENGSLYSHCQGPFLGEGNSSVWVGAMGVSILMPALGRARELAKRIQCGANLKGIGSSIAIYQNENKKKCPPSLEELVKAVELHPMMLICPSSKDEEGGCSYIYRGSDLTSEAGAQMILAYDKYENHDGEVRNVLFGDMHVDKLEEDEFLKAIEKDNELRRKMGLPEKPVKTEPEDD